MYLLRPHRFAALFLIIKQTTIICYSDTSSEHFLVSGNMPVKDDSCYRSDTLRRYYKSRPVYGAYDGSQKVNGSSLRGLQ
ncbi:hypothetical protein BJX76DRAFT_336994 [Aspergillus varians]